MSQLMILLYFDETGPGKHLVVCRVFESKSSLNNQFKENKCKKIYTVVAQTDESHRM